MAADNKQLVFSKKVEEAFGSLDELAYELMVNQPHLLDGGVESVASGLGLDRRVASWLLRESRDFQILLDGFVASSVWNAGERATAYGVLAERVTSGRERLSDSVRAMEYLDSKTGLQKQGSPRPAVAIQIVQEGDGNWETDYEGLTFGGQGKSVQRQATDVVDIELE